MVFKVEFRQVLGGQEELPDGKVEADKGSWSGNEDMGVYTGEQAN